MTRKLISSGEFQELLDRFGSDIAAWPTSEQAAANALLAASPDAQQQLAAARRLDDALRNAPTAPAGLVDRIMAASGAKKPPN